MVKSPWSSVVVPTNVPFTKTCATTRGSPVSESVIFPETCAVWATIIWMPNMQVIRKVNFIFIFIELTSSLEFMMRA